MHSSGRSCVAGMQQSTRFMRVHLDFEIPHFSEPATALRGIGVDSHVFRRWFSGTCRTEVYGCTCTRMLNI